MNLIMQIFEKCISINDLIEYVILYWLSLITKITMKYSGIISLRLYILPYNAPFCPWGTYLYKKRKINCASSCQCISLVILTYRQTDTNCCFYLILLLLLLLLLLLWFFYYAYKCLIILMTLGFLKQNFLALKYK